MTSQENPPRKTLKDLSFQEQDELQTSLDILKQKSFEGPVDRVATPTQEQIKKEQGEYQAEHDLSLQRISQDKGDIEKITREATEAAKLNEASNALQYEKQPAPEAIIEDDMDEEATAILSTSASSKPSATAFSKLKTGLMLMLGLGVAGQTMATEGGKKEEPKKPTQEQTIDTKKARPVKEVPPGYDPIGKEGDKSLYAKKWTGTLEKAKPGAQTNDPEGYMKTMIEKVKSGVPPQALLQQGLIDEDTAKDLEQYVDVVYTQPEAQKTKEVKKNPFAAYAEEGEVIYANGVAAATMHYPSRKSNNIEVGGGLNTSEEDVLFKFLDAKGNFNGKYARVKKGEDLNNALAGSKYFQGNSFKDLNDHALSVNDTYEIDGNDIANGTTVK